MNNGNQNEESLKRRDFLIRSGSVSSLMMLMGGIELKGAEASSEAPTEYKIEYDPVNVGVIGCGMWGRDIIAALQRLPNAPIVALCDSYGPYLRRSMRAVPEAQGHEDYHKLLEQADVQAVIVATPTHLHKDIVIAALEAGKHVYCEAPLASTIEDARAIAQAAQAHPKSNFQAGLQRRSDPQLHYVVDFVRSAAMGRTIKVKSQWHKKQSWRRVSPNAEFERESNWRLRKDVSPGLMGEIGVHQVDLASWYLMGRPKSVAGFGSIQLWNDGRDVPDTIDASYEYPNGIRFSFDCTLANSFDADWDIFFGTFGTIMIRERRAWMFKEVDSPLLGWEVYARKEGFFNETGIVLGANATKLTAQGDNPELDASGVDQEQDALHFALDAFINNSSAVTKGVEDFSLLFDASDMDGLREYMASIQGTFLPAATYKDGFESTVAALKGHEAVMQGKIIQLADEWFAIN